MGKQNDFQDKGGKKTAEGTITVIDAGARYGVHPLWKEYFDRAPMNYIAFEPDKEEAERLGRKYAAQNYQYRIEPLALMDFEGTVTFHITEHRGGCTTFEPNKESMIWETYLHDLGIVEEKVEVPCTTLDKFCADKAIHPDYIKLDTEGSELSILKGCPRELDESILGIYAEVQFNTTYEGASLFPRVMDYLNDHDFYLVNLTYDGKGSARNKYVKGHQYGILMGSDSFWLKKISELDSDGSLDDLIVEKVIKQSLFCFTHNATDVGVDFLQNLAARPGALDPWFGTPMFQYIDFLVQNLFRDLRQEPAHDEADLAETYEKIFRRSLKRGHEYFQSDEINP